MKLLNKTLLHSRKGQATVEYLLLAVVIIIIGKVIVSPMGKSLQEWATKMLGPKGYYACLMEYGLIPGKTWESLGISCGAYKVAALGDLDNLEGGSGLISGGGSSSSDSGSSGSAGTGDGDSSGEESDSEESDSENQNKGNRRKGASSNAGSDSDDSSSSGSDSSDIQSDRFPALKSGNKSQRSSGKSRRKARKTKKSGTKDIELKADNNLSEEDETGEMGAGYLGRISVEYEDDEKDKPPPVFQAQGSIQTGGETPSAQKNKNKLQVKRFEGGKSGDIKDLKPMTFSGYIKWLFIAILIIAVILVIGSQILEFQNADT